MRILHYRLDSDGDTIREKLRSLMCFCLNNNMSYPLTCSKGIYEKLDCYCPYPLPTNKYKLDENLHDYSVRDDYDTICHVIVDSHFLEIY